MTDTMFETEEQAAARIQAFRLRRALEDAPAQFQFVQSIAVGGQGEKGETLREWSAPMRITAADDVDAAFKPLIEYAMFFAEKLNLPISALTAAAWSVRREVRGFRAGTTPEGAWAIVQVQTMLLLVHWERIAETVYFDNYAKRMSEILWELRSHYPMNDRKPRDVFPRACWICGEYAVGAEWGDGDAADVTVSCEHCGDVLPSSSFRQIVASLGHIHHWQETGKPVDGRLQFVCGPDGHDRCGATGIEGRPGIDRHAVVELDTPERTPEPFEAGSGRRADSQTRTGVIPKRLPRIEPEEPVVVCSSCWITPCVCGGAS